MERVRLSSPIPDYMTRCQHLLAYCSIINDKTPLPPPAATLEEDDQLFAKEPWIEPPINMDYGTNIHIGKGVFLNYYTTFIDTCSITIGARTMTGPNCSFYSGTHPLDPGIRNGTNGPESGKEIHIGEDCWLGGNVIILPGVTLGKGVTIGAGSVVTKVRHAHIRYVIFQLIIRTFRHSTWQLAIRPEYCAK